MSNTNNLKEQVAVLLAESDSEILRDFFNSDAPSEGYKYNSEDTNEFLKKENELNIKHEHMDSFGGEGEGEMYWVVYKFTKETEVVYVKFSGSYYSYSGSDYDEFFFVEPKEVTRIEYV